MASIRDLDGVRRGKDFYTVDPQVLVLDYEWNCREDYGDLDALKDYIRENGVPGIIRAFKRGTQLIVTDGYRRLTCVNQLRDEGVIIEGVTVELEQTKNEAELVITQITSNSSKNFNAVETAKAYRKYLSYGGSIDDLAKRLGKSKQTIEGALGLADTSPVIHEMIRSGEVAPTTAIQVINSTDTSGEAVEILQTAVETAKAEGKTKATVSHVEAVKEAKGQAPKKPNLKKILEAIIVPQLGQTKEDGSLSLDLTAEELQMMKQLLGLE